MEEESWSRLLDSDASPEQLAKEVSAEFLNFVREEAGALVAVKRTKVLISLLYLPDDKLVKLDEAITQVCDACETDAEEWVRVISGIVLRWLKKIPKDREDAFAESTRQIAKAIAAAERPGESGRFSLPMDVLPTHWPFLASQSLPSNFDIAGANKNQHFTPRPRSEGIKKIKIIQAPLAESTIPTPVITVDKLPAKVKELLENAPLLTSEHRDLILKFFASPSTCGVPAGMEIPISESRSNAEGRPGQIEILQVLIKLDPTVPKWNIVKKKKFAVGKI